MGIVDTPFFVRSGYGYDRGFDDFVWVRGQGDDTRPQERSDYRATWRSESDRLVARTVTEAEHWLERHYKENFFLYVDTWDPHEPWDAPEYYTAMYRPGYEGRQLYPSYGKWEEAGLTRDDIDLAHAMYCGEVTMVDFWMGRLLAKLDVLGLRDNTIIFFLSDHGFYFGEHGYFGKAEWINDNWATVTDGTTVPPWLPESWLLTVGWSPLYQELTRVPLIVHALGLTPGHRQALTARCSDSEPMRTSSHERLLRRPQTKGGLHGGKRYVQGPGGPHLLREPLLGQTIRRQGPAGRILGSEEETRLCSEARREGKEAPCRRSRGTPLPHPPGAPRLHRAMTGLAVSRSTMCRAIARIGSTRKKGDELLRNATSSRGRPGG